MKSFKQYIKENITAFNSRKTWDYVKESIKKDSESFFLPLSSKILERALGRNRRITALHILNPASIANLVKMQGSTKSISTFTEYKGSQEPAKLVKGGIAMGGGAVAEVEGDILLSYKRDAWTELDRQGRRWFKPFELQGSGVSKKFISIYKQKIADEFYKDILSAYERVTPEEEHGYHDYAKVGKYLDRFATKEEKAKIIKQYYKFADRLIQDQHDLILEPFFHSMGADDTFYNEIVMSKIKIKKLYIYNDYAVKPVSHNNPNETFGDLLKNNRINYETFDDKDTGKVISKLFDRVGADFRKII